MSQPNHHSAPGDRISHRPPRLEQGHALALAHAEVLGGVLLAQLRVARVDDGDAVEVELEIGDEVENALLAADQDRLGETFVQDDLAGVQNLLVSALGKDQLHRPALGLVDHESHDVPRFAQAALELIFVGLEVESPARDAALHRRLGDGGRLANQHPVVERLGNQILGPEVEPAQPVGLHHRVGHVLLGQLGQRSSRRQLHLLVDARGAHVQRAAEDERKAEDVVHLVGVVGPAGRHQHVAPRFECVLVGDLGIGVGHGEDDRLIGHRADHLLSEAAGHREADKDVGADQRLLQGAGRRVGRQSLLEGIHAFRAALVDDPLGVAEDEIGELHPERDVVVGAGDPGRSGSVEDDPDLVELLAGDLHRVEQGGARDDRGAVLVVVEDRDRQLPLEGLLDLEALRCLDVLEVDAAEGRLEELHRTDDLGRISRIDLDVEDVDVGEALEQDALALHHGLAGERADVAEAEDRGAVGDDGHQIALGGVAVRVLGPPLDLETGNGDTGRVGERKIALGHARLAGDDLELPLAAVLVVVECVSISDHHGQSPGASPASSTT